MLIFHHLVILDVCTYYIFKELFGRHIYIAIR